MTPEDKLEKLQKRYEVLEKLIEHISHGRCKIEWQDNVVIIAIIKFEGAEKEVKITK